MNRRDEPTADPGRQTWLVYHNCQAGGLANCLNLLGRGIKVEAVDQFTAPDIRDPVLERLNTFDRIIVERRLADTFPPSVDPERLVMLPTLEFHGYHPDFSIVLGETGTLPGPIGSSHSILALAAYRAGVPQERAIDLFCAEVYEACGYFDLWEPSRTFVIASYARFGIDIRRAFVQWSRRGPFMYSLIHPRMSCVRDIARLVLERCGIQPLDTDCLPVDPHPTGEVLPVYPEIALRLGMAGSYLFKRGGRYEIEDLAQFVERSYRHYDLHADSLSKATLRPPFVERMARVAAAVEARR